MNRPASNGSTALLIAPSFQGLSEKLNELEHAVSRQAERFQAVLEIGAEISSAKQLDDLLRLVMDRLTALLGAEASTLFMLDRDKKELWSRVLKGSSLKEIRVPLDSGIVGSVVQSGKPLLIADAYADIRFNPEIDRVSGFRTRSICAAPLRHVSGRVLGVVEVLDRKVNAFGPEDLALVEAVGTQIAAVLENVLLYEELRRQNEQLIQAKYELSQRVEELDLLLEVEKAVSATETESDLLEQILAKVCAVLEAGAGSILLLEDEEDGGALYFRSARGARSESLVALALKPGQGIAGRVAETGKPIRVLQAEDSDYYDRSIAKKLNLTIGAVLAVPIPGRDGPLGALELLNKKGGFTEADERAATLLAVQMGRAIGLRIKREEEARGERLASIGQMLSGVLHDLRTPMTIISGYASLMASEEDGKEREGIAQVIEKQVEQINAMTRETLAFARGEQEILLRKVYLQNFVAEVEEYLRKDFERTQVELRVQPNYTGAVRVDENKLKRVVYNIARNAVQAMPQGGRFTFSVDRDGDDLLLRFVDNGPGIPAEIQDKLFGSFVTAGKKNGTGLGLAIVKKIAEEHGGSVSFKSKPGKGTTFEVRVPAGTPA